MELEKPIPIECLEQGYPMTMARQMDPEDLTREDCIRLLEAEFPQHIIAQKYNFSGEAFFAKLREWGLNKPHGSWASSDPQRSHRVPKVPVQPIQEVATVQEAQPIVAQQEAVLPVQEEERLTAIEWLRKTGTLPDTSEIAVLTSKDWKKDDAAELLKAGATYNQIAAYYGMSSVGSVSYYVKRDGLVGVSANKAFGVKPVKTAEIGDDRQEAAKEEEMIEITGDGSGTPLPPISEGAPSAVKDGCFNCGHIVVDPYIHCDLPAGEAFPGCVDAGYPKWIPRTTPISEAVTQAKAAGEIKINTAERPTPPKTIDLAAMHRFVPGLCGFRKSNQTITFGKEGTIRLSAGLVLTGPAENRDPGSKFSAAIYVDDDGRTVVVRLEDGGAVFNGAKDGTAKKATAKPVVNYLAETGIGLPATYQAQWSVADWAWVGKLAAAEKVSA